MARPDASWRDESRLGPARFDVFGFDRTRHVLARSGWVRRNRVWSGTLGQAEVCQAEVWFLFSQEMQHGGEV